MKKLLLTLLLLTVIGCTEADWERLTSVDGLTEAERIESKAKWQRAKDRKAMLKDGRIHIDMTDDEFARLWERPHDSWIDRSTSRYGVTEWWRFNYDCEPSSPFSLSTYHFCFENGILDYWSKD